MKFLLNMIAAIKGNQMGLRKYYLNSLRKPNPVVLMWCYLTLRYLTSLNKGTPLNKEKISKWKKSLNKGSNKKELFMMY